MSGNNFVYVDTLWTIKFSVNSTLANLYLPQTVSTARLQVVIQLVNRTNITTVSVFHILIQRILNPLYIIYLEVKSPNFIIVLNSYDIQFLVLYSNQTVSLNLKWNLCISDFPRMIFLIKFSYNNFQGDLSCFRFDTTATWVIDAKESSSTFAFALFVIPFTSLLQYEFQSDILITAKSYPNFYQ